MTTIELDRLADQLNGAALLLKEITYQSNQMKINVTSHPMYEGMISNIKEVSSDLYLVLRGE